MGNGNHPLRHPATTASLDPDRHRVSTGSDSDRVLPTNPIVAPMPARSLSLPVLTSLRGYQFSRGDLCFIQTAHAPVQLHLVDCLGNLTDARTRFETKLQQMPAQQNRCGGARCNFELARAFDKPFLCLSREPFFPRHTLGVATKRICPGHPIQQIELAFPCQATKSAVANFIPPLIELPRLEVVAHKRQHLRAHVITVESVNIEPIENVDCRLDPTFLVLA